MILRMLTLILVFGSSFTSTLFAGSERGNRLISEAGGIAGADGVIGIGIPGVSGVLDYTDFYALMPGDNIETIFTAPIAIGAPVLFPQTGSTTGVITSLTSSTFLLPAIGTYLIKFQASIDEPGQLMLRLNNVPLANTVVGRDTGTIQIVGISLLTTTSPNSVLEVINPPTATAALTLTPIAGGTHPVSAHLVVIRLR